MGPPGKEFKVDIPGCREIRVPLKEGYYLWRAAQFGRGLKVSGPRLKSDTTVLRYVSGILYI